MIESLGQRIMLGSLVFVFTVSAVARLGETPQQIADRYGEMQKRVDHSTNLWVGYYTHKDIQIGVVFLNNKSAAEKLTPISPRNGFEPAEVEGLREKIAGGPWRKLEEKGLKTTWTNDTAGTSAQLERRVPKVPVLTITSADLFAYFEAERKRSADQKDAKKKKVRDAIEGF